MSQKTLTAEEVRRIRKSLGMTQRELAVALNVKSTEMIANWETGWKGGKEYLPTGTAVIAIQALLATLRVITLVGIHHPAAHLLLEQYTGPTRKKLERAAEGFEE